MTQTRRRPSLFQPATSRAIKNGADQIIGAIRPTLGPIGRVVAVERLLDSRGPEVLDSGGLIAKRIIQLSNLYADVGAMFVRDFLWRLYDQEGDGTATAAVLFQAVYNAGVRHISAGHNARRLQHFLEEGTRLILDELTRITTPIAGKEQLTNVAYTVCHNRELSDLLGEIFDIIGAHGRLEIRTGNTRGLEREYVEGMYWDRGVLAREMIGDWRRMRTDLEDAALVISDLQLRTPEQALTVLEQAGRSGVHSLLIIADEISDGALALLLANNRPNRMQIVAVKTPGFGHEEQAEALTDLAMLTGGRAFLRATGDSFQSIANDDFGHARRVWVETQNFGVIGGKGDPRRLRRHLAALRTAYDETLDIVRRGKLQVRLGKLLGGSATLRIGGVSEREIEARKELAERTATAVRGALQQGIAPGGGAAFLACQPALRRRMQAGSDPDERAAYGILAQAMAEPMRVIVANAGYDPSDALAEVRLAGPGHGYDVLAGRVACMMEAGVVDPASVQKAAAYAGLNSAALALTIDVIVHRSEQPTRASIRPPGQRKQL
jgi:chaperonin GroEL